MHILLFADMSHCLWDDMVDNEAVVRSLFPSCSPAHVKDTDPSVFSYQQEESQDGNPAPLKRRRIMELDDENLMDISSRLPEPQATSDDFLVEVCENLQIVDPSSSSSVWYLANEESLSSADDTAEQSSGSWRVGCVSDSDASDVQELVHHAVNPPPPINVVIRKAIPEKASGLVAKVRQTMNSTISNVAHSSLQCLEPNQQMHFPGNVRIKKAGQDKTAQCQSSKVCSGPVSLQPSTKEFPSPGLTQTSKECPSPGLAYPFALVKPIGIQGDITLQDINQRINTTSYRVKPRFEQPKSTLSSPYSGKSVLALTKIYTEGNGTITIMRTKG